MLKYVVYTWNENRKAWEPSSPLETRKEALVLMKNLQRDFPNQHHVLYDGKIATVLDKGKEVSLTV